MNFSLNQLAKTYFSSAWLPTALAMGILGLLFVNELVFHVPIVGLALLLALGLGMLGILASAIIQIAKGRKPSGLINLIAFPLVGFAVANGIGYLMFADLFNDEPDNFGKNIVIPEGMKVSDPLNRFDEGGEPVVDEFTEKIVAAFSENRNDNGAASVSTSLTLLNEFGTTNRQKLIHYLASSPRWFVTEERNKSYAYRRLPVGGRWQNSLNGFYSSFSVVPASGSHFQTRIIIGFDGPVFVDAFRRAGILTTASIGTGDVTIRVVDDIQSNQGKESYFLLLSTNASVEVFEQSRLDVRPVTHLALAEIQRELAVALIATNTPMVVEVPVHSSHESEIQLASGMQGGIYQVRAFANPGEAGRVYLKVFEATENTPLSAERIGPRSVSRIGWSTNSSDKFLYQSEITVYEGDWGIFYPARFELWFMPDTKTKERKLVERIFRIEGWQR